MEQVNFVIGQSKKLLTVLGAGGLTGHVSLGALGGLFRPENALMLAVLFMAGPGAIITAVFLEGSMKERIFAALLAGILATIIVVLAAGIGTKALSFLNLNILKISGGIAVLLIGLIMMGVKIPDKIPLLIIGLGIIAGGIWR
jgi:small neutral amino acid transporter SnatA (MarC family)